MGVREDLIGQVITQANLHHISPILMGAVLMQESAGGRNPLVQPGASQAGNVMQITPKGAKTAPPMNEAESIAQGAAHLQADISSSSAGGGVTSLHDVLQRYNGPAMDRINPNYVSNVSRNMAGAGGFHFSNVPGYLPTISDVKNAELTGSYASLGELNTILPVVNTSIEGLTKSIDRLRESVDRRTRAPGASTEPVIPPM
jgi:hypothetical protein